MICLGLRPEEKSSVVSTYAKQHGINKVLALSPVRFRQSFGVEEEHIEWADIIRYRVFYRLLQEIGSSTLIVINECLRTQNRHDLTYNCIRNYLNQTPHQIIFQHLPLIDRFDDFMILLDFDTRSRWKMEKEFQHSMIEGVDLRVARVPISFRAIDVPVNEKVRAIYAKKKRQLIDGIGLKDPHTIPRNLYLVSGKSKLSMVDPKALYVGRNNRFKLPELSTYKAVDSSGTRIVFEFCHNFIAFSDFLYVTGQSETEVLVADLKVDQWYFDRYSTWASRIHDAYTAIQSKDCS